jgi:hypothetical protein
MQRKADDQVGDVVRPIQKHGNNGNNGIMFFHNLQNLKCLSSWQGQNQ